MKTEIKLVQWRVHSKLNIFVIEAGGGHEDQWSSSVTGDSMVLDDLDSKDRGPGGETFVVTAEINGAVSHSVLDTEPKEVITTPPVAEVEGERFWKC